MSEAVLTELPAVADEPSLKPHVGRQAAEIALARGTIAARICAQEALLATVEALPDLLGHQREEITGTLARLSELQDGSDAAVTAWYQAERETAHTEKEGTENDALATWLALLPQVQTRLHALRTSSDTEAFPLLDSVNDACEGLFATINEVTDSIETARQASEEPAVAQTFEPAPEAMAATPISPSSEKAPAVPVLSVPDNFMERLQTFLGQKSQIHIAEIVREFFGVPRLEPATFGVLRKVLHEADAQGLVRNLRSGYYASAGQPDLPTENTSTTRAAAVQGRQRDRELDQKLKALNLGSGPIGLKPRQRGRRYASKR